MTNGVQYGYSKGEDIHVTFDSEGYIVEAKGFGMLMWSSEINVDKSLIGKHVDELAEMLEKNGVTRDVYVGFEKGVHVPLLKEMLKSKNKI